MNYGTGTIHYLDLLAQEQISGENILHVTKELRQIRQEHPDDAHRVKTILLTPRAKVGGTNKALAREFGIHATEISMILKLERPLRSEVLLAAVLLLDDVPTVAEVNHLLMEVGGPCLFWDTAYPDINRRNYLLEKILTYADRTGPYPGKGSWLDFAEAVLDRFRDYYQPLATDRWGKDELEMEGLRRLNLTARPEITFTEQEEAMFARWRREIDCVSHSDYALTRNELLTAYMKRRGISSRGEAIRTLADNVYITPETCSALFSKMSAANSKGSRETVLSLAVNLGCGLTEANKLLAQINEPLLYPFQTLNDDEYWLKQLIQPQA